MAHANRSKDVDISVDVALCTEINRESCVYFYKSPFRLDIKGQ